MILLLLMSTLFLVAKIYVSTVAVYVIIKNTKILNLSKSFLPPNNMIPALCLLILDKLNLNPMDSVNGYFIVCEQPMGNNIMLNILRPAVLRQYYGINKSMICIDIVSRCTYGFGSKRNNVCMDSNKFATRTFNENMKSIAQYLNKFI